MINCKTKFILALLLITVAGFVSKAQMGLKLEFNRKNYIQHETIFAQITIRNYSAHTIAFGKSKLLKGRIGFDIYTPDGGIASKFKNTQPEVEGFVIKPGETKKIIIPLSKYYSVTQLGRYKATAFLEHAQLKADYRSNPSSFTVSKGVVVWKTQVGIPDLLEKDNPIKQIQTRNYKIKSLFDGSDKVFYLVIDNPSYVYSIKRIGREMAGKIPICETDNLSRLHVLQKLSSNIFVYLCYDIDGSLETKKVYRKTHTAPTLVRNPADGKVIVAGGKIALKGDDYMEEIEKPFNEDGI